MEGNILIWHLKLSPYIHIYQVMDKYGPFHFHDIYQDRRIQNLRFPVSVTDCAYILCPKAYKYVCLVPSSKVNYSAAICHLPLRTMARGPMAQVRLWSCLKRPWHQLQVRPTTYVILNTTSTMAIYTSWYAQSMVSANSLLTTHRNRSNMYFSTYTDPYCAPVQWLFTVIP